MLHLSMTCWPLYDFPCFNKISKLYLLTTRKILPYFQRFLLGYKIKTIDPTSRLGSSTWLLLPVFDKCPATISSQNMLHTCLNIASFCSESLSRMSNCSPVLILGYSTSLMVRSPDSVAKIGREFNRPAIFVNNRSTSKMLSKGCIGSFLIFLHEDLSIVFTW